ncbi:MAG TPA: hypothetical protein VFN10_13175 [Thermoanaerobaculia bacterium]|nr:hypothetical protein [Thermoanaerobaculia bacterium]
MANPAMTSTEPAAPTLTRRASLSFVNSLFTQVAAVATMFIVTPIIIRNLGLTLYGAWLMIQQTIGYLSIGDLRPMSTLKFSIAVRQHVEDPAEKRRLLGAALRLWAYTFPVLLLIGAVLVWQVPSFIHVSPAAITAVRVAMTVAVVNLAIDRVLAVPSNVLVGMNIEYRAMGVNAASSILSGVLTVIALRLGYGLPGLALATITGPFLFSVVQFFIARRAVHWFGYERPAPGEMKEFTILSGWISLAAIASGLVTGMDIFLLGVLLGPAVAAVYATTGAAYRVLQNPLGEILGSGSAGISALCGQQDWPRVRRLRTEMHTVSIALMSVAGFVITIVNRDFIRIWMKREIYAGTAVTVLLAGLGLVTLLYRADRIIAASMMEFRAQTVAMTLSGSITLVCGAISAKFIGPAAIVFWLIVSHIVIIIYIGNLIAKRTGSSLALHAMSLARPLMTAVALFTVAAIAEPYVHVSGWLQLIGVSAVLSVAALLVTAFVGLDASMRAMLASRIGHALAAVGVRRRRQEGNL